MLGSQHCCTDILQISIVGKSEMIQKELHQNNILLSVEYNPDEGYPAEVDLYFKCTDCQFMIKSLPHSHAEATCTCGNLSIDIDTGRLSVRDHNKEPLLFKLIPRRAK